MSYSSSTFDCFADIGVCVYVYFCTPCSVCTIAEKIGASDTHGCMQTAKSICCTAYCGCCTACCCPESCYPCFLTSLLLKSMAKHGITVPPPPCGAAECCSKDCYCQMMFCTGCTLCLMLREANKLPPV
eukprot:gene10416-13992_t